MYEVTTEPPFEAGAVKATVAVRLPVAVATTDAGAPGALTTGATITGATIACGCAAANGEKLVVTPQTWPLAKVFPGSSTQAPPVKWKILSVEAPSKQTVAEPLNVPVGVMSTIFVEAEMINGVADAGAGFVATGATVTAVGAVPPKFKVIAGSAAVAGITACVAPEGIAAT